MAKGSLVNFDTSGLMRHVDRLRQTPAKLEQVRKRSIATLSRRLKAEAARQVSEVQLNLSPGQIAPFINVKHTTGGNVDYVSVTASRDRIPLKAYKAKVSKKSGATVTTWKDAAPVQLPHAFKRPDGNVWQRVPYKGQKGADRAPSGLVQRLPIVVRKGPSMKRALQPAGPSKNDHGREQVVAHLMEFGQSILSAEIKRLLSLK